jgi:hypothetical protein
LEDWSYPLERVWLVVERVPVKTEAFHTWILRGTSSRLAGA